jgi:hypothetical protein
MMDWLTEEIGRIGLRGRMGRSREKGKGRR